MAPDPYKYFRIESRELLDQMGQGVLDLEKGDGGAEIVARLLRQAHTLKGAARVVKQPEIADLAHAVEDVLSPFRDQPAVPPDRIEGLLQRLDAIAARVKLLGLARPPEGQETGQVTAPTATAPATAAMAAGAATDAPASGPVEQDDVESLLDGITETYVQVAALRKTVGTVERVRQLAELAVDHLGAPRQLGTPRGQRAPDGVTPKLRAMVDELRGLVAGVERNLSIGVEQVSRELRQVREGAQRLRLQASRSMFVVLERTARDVAAAQGKRVVFEARGGEVRLSPPVLGVIQNALVQAVRNAVAHGIEREADRIAAGKPAVGRVSLDVVRRGNRVVFLCRDDGGGVDLEAVRSALARKGVTTDDVNQADAAGLLRLMLRGGISTAGAVSEISGRGVGLDVIGEAARRLGGQIDIRTVAGQGTTLELVVPVSLSSMEALIVEAGAHVAAIPLESVRRTLRLTPADLAHSAEGASIVFEGQVIPFAPLLRSLRGQGDAQAADGRAWTVVIVEAGQQRAAVGVDRLLGAEEIVVRPLPAFAPADPVVVGASLDAAGNPQIVLDPERLVGDARLARAVATTPTLPAPILVIDDSMTTRMLEQSILESAGYAVEVVASAEEAYEKALARAYSLFLVDVEMPGMDGFTFVQRTRADPALRHVPAILVTSRDAPEDRQRGLDVGASAYVVKSEFDQADLLKRIRGLVG
ncbi:MAG: two-component system, chemotaxis family, sensor kinase CheA [Myxococcales bacterium]|jgi:two-component system chemotaxis sensor kinase CheA|nr:two-component system, chemotaxis family, sensor kinase CheA [Myxococcales bacterium]